MTQERNNDGFDHLEAFIKQFDDKGAALIKVLYEAQHTFGFLGKDVVMFISDRLDVPASKIYGVVSFYSYFTTEPKGRCQIKVCLGTACFVRGAEKIVRQLENQLDMKMGTTSADHHYSLEALRCVGACGLAPVVLVNDTVYGKFGADSISKILKEHAE